MNKFSQLSRDTPQNTISGAVGGQKTGVYSLIMGGVIFSPDSRCSLLTVFQAGETPGARVVLKGLQEHEDEKAATMFTRKTAPRAPRPQPDDRTPNTAGHFRRAEDGAIVILALYFFVIMLVVAGTAIDIARHETSRVTLQNTVDRAILAATDLDQTLEPRAVVQDYFDKAGLGSHLTGIRVEEGPNYRSVSARAAMDVDTWFIKGSPPEDIENSVVTLSDWYEYMGDDVWSAVASGTAENGLPNIEISLIVDVSGSMNYHNRIQNLQVAAKEFIDTMITRNDDGNIITISVVPYAHMVNIGPDMAAHYNLIQPHTYSYCPKFDDAAFHTTGIDPTEPLEILAHFEQQDGFLLFSNLGHLIGEGPDKPISVPWCPNEEFRGNAVLPFSLDADDLKEAIDNLNGYGTTGIDLGMKWGAALLDPGTRPVIDGLIADDVVSGSVSGRPYDYGERNTMKVIILMTDGQNTTQWDISEPYKTGMSDVWVKRDYPGQTLADMPDDYSRFSIRYDDNGTPDDHTDDSFMRRAVTDAERELSHPYGYAEYDDSESSPESTETVTRLSWVEILATWQPLRASGALLFEAYSRGYIPPADFHALGEAPIIEIYANDADARLSNICAATKEQGSMVYTIAFEAPDSGKAVLSDCASSDSHYFDVEGTDISKAFAAIASDIKQLRLTQ